MKKLLSLALVFVLVLTTLTSCDFLTNLFQTEDQYDIAGAAEYLDGLYKEDLNKTPVDFQVVAQVKVNDVTYTVAWAVDTDKVTVGTAANGFVTIDVDEKSAEEVKYTLTATITDPAGKTVTKEYKLTVPKYEAMSWEDYIAAEAGDMISEVSGVVTGIVSKSLGSSYNCFFMQDATGGGYYIYGMTEDPIADLGIAVGMTVTVAGGVKDIYNGTHEIKPSEQGLKVTIVSEEITPVAPLDYTEIFKNAADLKDIALVEKQSSLVTLKGVEISGQELSNGYLYFKLGDKEAYLRISSSTLGFPTANKEAFIAEHASKMGYIADVTGVISIFNNAFYLVPVSTDAFVYGAAIEKTPAEMAQATLDQLSITTSYSSNTVVDLPVVGTAYTDVVLTWASNNAAAVVDGAKLTITVPDAATEVVLTVTATCGDVTLTKEITIKLSKTITPIADIITLGSAQEHNNYTADKYLVAGIITEVYNDTYGNMYITDELGNVLTIYGTYSADGALRYDAMESKPVAGDYVVIFGVVGQYNGTAQIKNGWIMSFTTPTSVKDAIDTGAAMDHNTYTEDKVLVSGVITEVYNTTYGNMYITDAEGNVLTIYGTYSATGANRYDALTVKPAAGDTVVIYGILGQYNGTAQIKNGWMVAHTAGSTEEPPVDEPPVTDDPAANSTLTIEQAIALGASKEHDTYTEGKYYVTGIITEVYNTQWGNLKIKDEAGNILTVYGTYSADGSTRYDALEVKPVAGDTITVYGIIGQFNGTAQVKNGWITAHTANSTPSTPSTPSNPETPDVPTGDPLATFTFGENGEAKHYDGATNPGLADGASFTAGDYTIVLSGVSKAYAEARDAKGNSCLKLGTGSAIATFSFDVAANVNKVVIEIAAYKANTAKVVVNGVEYDISAYASNNGEYYTIVVDTTTTKTVSLETVSGATRAMIDTIAFYG